MNRLQLHALFVRKFGRNDVTLFNLRDLLHRKGWRGGPVRAIEYTDTEITFLRRHQTMRLIDLHAMFVKKFNRPDVKYFNLKDVCHRRGLRARSYERWAPLGSEKLSRDGFIIIKISHTRGRANHLSFALKHRWLWEHVHGPIPEGHKLTCLDGNRLNTDPSNWACAPNGVLNRLRKRDFASAPAELKPTIMAVSRLEHQVCTRNRRKARALPSRTD